MTYTCPKDPSHQSTDADYCSVCGAKIAGVPGGVSSLTADMPASAVSAVSAASAAVGGGESCPDCGTPRASGAKFCEVCRYNFETRTSSGAAPIPVAAPPPMPAPVLAAPDPMPAPPAFTAPAPAAPSVAPPLPGFAPTPVVNAPGPPDTTPAAAPTLSPDALLRRWEVVACVDASLYPDPDPQTPCPVGEPERTFPLDFAENLIGRRSDSRDIHPEIPLNDPGVSHRHAKLLRQPDGSFLLLDVGSTNGTQLNGVELQQGVRTPLQDGDQITLGCWTRLTIRSLS